MRSLNAQLETQERINAEAYAELDQALKDVRAEIAQLEKDYHELEIRRTRAARELEALDQELEDDMEQFNKEKELKEQQIKQTQAHCVSQLNSLMVKHKRLKDKSVKIDMN